MKASEVKRSYWKQHIEQWKHSGQSQKAYCESNQLKLHQFVYWKDIFEPQLESDSHRLGGFVAVHVANAASSERLIIRLPNGICLGGITPNNLAQVKALVGALL